MSENTKPNQQSKPSRSNDEKVFKTQDSPEPDTGGGSKSSGTLPVMADAEE